MLRVRDAVGQQNPWYATAPGRMEPSLQRAARILLDRRADLPPGLTAALDSWKRTLDTLNAPKAA